VKNIGFDFDPIRTDGDHMLIFVGGAPRYLPLRIMHNKKYNCKRVFQAISGSQETALEKRILGQ
jgi:hypothetical protein